MPHCRSLSIHDLPNFLQSTSRYTCPSLLRTRQTAGTGKRLVLSCIYKTSPCPCGPTVTVTVSHTMSESVNISAPQETTQPGYHKALDERLYTLNDEERSFFKEQSGIQDDDELKAHIVQVQAEAYKVCNHEPRKSCSSKFMQYSCLRFILILVSASSIS